jgi:DNA-binding transcriptional LysR family regulator
MELKWLEDFTSLANTANFSRSAEERNITQSAFSRRIKSLEHWLGTELVDRATFPVTLTQAGRAFLEVAQRVVRDLREVRDQIQEESRAKGATVTFAALHTLSLTFYPVWLRQIEATVGPLSTRLLAESKTMEDYMLLLTEGICDFLLSFAHPSNPVTADGEVFAYKVIGSERILPVSLADEDGAALHRLSADQSSIRFLGYSPHSFLGRCLAARADQLARYPLETVYENSMAEGLRAMMLAGYGLAWLPESCIDDELPSGRVVRAGEESFDFVVEVRLYRSLRNRRAKVEQIWAAVDPLPFRPAPQASRRPARRPVAERRPKEAAPHQ